MSNRNSSQRRVVIMGAAGRDFHNFNMACRDNPQYHVVAFTAAQIPDIAGRRYPAELAGRLYPNGVPILPEEDLPRLILDENVDLVWLSYSDLSHEDAMHKASIVLATGADFGFLGPDATMLKSDVPVISVCAVRTGVGKSAVSRHIVKVFRGRGRRVVAIRHPMPYGDLVKQAVQRFATYDDLDLAEATIEEREEYEPYIDAGAVVFAGVDYARILEAAEKEAEVILWDGGNNDFPFLRPDLSIVLLDAHRPGHETRFHPGETNFRMADVLIINKVDSAPAANVEQLRSTVQALRPDARVTFGELAISADRSEMIRGKRVVLVEDGPTLTHGGMKFGAGTVAANKYGAAEVVDARPYAVGAIAETFREFPHLEGEVPAMGYSDQQIKDLEATLRAVPADVVVDATPVDLSRLVKLDKPLVNVEYEFSERGDLLPGLLGEFEKTHLARSAQPRE